MRSALVCWTVVLLASAATVEAVRSYYMDSPTTCGQTLTVGDDAIEVQAQGPVPIQNPPSSCVLTLQSSYSESGYSFEIVVEAAVFGDACVMTLDIYDGPAAGNRFIKSIGCSSPSTSNYYSKDRVIKLQLRRTKNTYQPGSHFMLRIRAFRAAGVPPEYIGTYRLPAGAIIGIVLGLIVIIVFAILMGWCYKTGRLGIGDRDVGTNNTHKTSTENLSRSGAPGNDNIVSWNMKHEDKMSMSAASRSNFDLNDSQVWDNLMNSNNDLSGRKQPIKPIKVDPPTVRTLGINRNNNNDNDNRQGRGDSSIPRGRSYQDRDNGRNLTRENVNQWSKSPGSRQRGRQSNADGKVLNVDDKDDPEYYNVPVGKRGQGADSGPEKRDKKRTASGLFENPDEEGYLYDYDHVQTLSDSSKKPQDFETELKEALRKNSLKRSQSKDQSADAPGAPTTALSSTSELENIDFSNENLAVPKYDAEGAKGQEGPDAQSSPRTKKKRSKSSKQKGTDDAKVDDLDTSNEGQAPKSPKSKAKKKKTEDVLPEAFAPIFGGEDPANVQGYGYPSNQYQPGPQGGGYPVPYDPRYPMGTYPFQPGMPGFPPVTPYQQAGQAQWYVENTPTGQQMAFAMRTHTEPSQSSDDQAVGTPGYTSTPYYQNQYGAPQGRRHHHKGKHGADTSLVPAGTILDDPQIPQPGTSLMRYNDDPVSGIKTAQVVWTDSKPDPTDPPPDSNPQITRKTITRVTTRATKDELPDAPNPNGLALPSSGRQDGSLQDLSFRTAQQLQATGQEPAFMSPTRGAARAYPPSSAIQYVSQTPERANSAFYTHQGQPDPIPGSPAPPVIHQAPNRNNAIKEHITLSSAED